MWHATITASQTSENWPPYWQINRWAEFTIASATGSATTLRISHQLLPPAQKHTVVTRVNPFGEDVVATSTTGHHTQVAIDVSLSQRLTVRFPDSTAPISWTASVLDRPYYVAGSSYGGNGAAVEVTTRMGTTDAVAGIAAIFALGPHPLRLVRGVLSEWAVELDQSALHVDTLPTASNQVPPPARRVWHRYRGGDEWTFRETIPGVMANYGSTAIRISDDVLRPVFTSNDTTYTRPVLAQARWLSSTAFNSRRRRATSTVGIAMETGARVYGASPSVLTMLADLDHGQIGPAVPWPWVYVARNNQVRAGVLSEGVVREWRSADGLTWEPAQEAETEGCAGVWCPSIGHGAGQVLALVACDQAAGQLLAWCRHGYDEPWQGPAVVAEVDGITPAYITEQPDGRWEVGWRAGGEWHHADAAWPTGTWEVRDA